MVEQRDCRLTSVHHTPILPQRGDHITSEAAAMSTALEPTGKDTDYYRSAVFLREKHLRTHVTSGRLFHAWALDLIPFAASDTILDAGCGWGRFTWHLIDAGTISAANLLCADLSLKM